MHKLVITSRFSAVGHLEAAVDSTELAEKISSYPLAELSRQ